MLLESARLIPRQIVKQVRFSGCLGIGRTSI
jgi:hypothetical protein